MAFKTSRELLSNDLERLAQMLASRYDIKVIFEGDRCETNGRTIWLPSLPEGDDVDDATYEKFVAALHGMLDHETAHALFTDWTALKQIKTEGVRTWTNIVEDARIEGEMRKFWRGSGVNLKRCHDWILDKMLEKWDDMSHANQLFFVSIMYAKRYYDCIEKVPNGEELLGELEPLEPALDLAEKLDTTWQSVALGVWLARRTGFDVEDEMEHLKGVFGEEFEDALDAVAEALAESVAEGDLDPGMVHGWDEIDEKVREKGKVHKRRMKDSLTEEEAECVTETTYVEEEEEKEEEEEEEEESVLVEEPDPVTPELPDMSGAHEDEIDPRGFIRSEVRKMRRGIEKGPDYYVPYSTSGDRVVLVRDGDRAWFMSHVQALRKVCGVLVRRLRMSLASKGRVRTEYDKTFGTLNPRALPQLLLRGDPRVFKQRAIGEVVRARISLVVDESGSMYGGRIHHARDAAIVFGEFCELVGLPFEILGFTTASSGSGRKKWSAATEDEQDTFTRWDDLVTNVYKEFPESWRKVGHRLQNMGAHCENVDGESVMIAAKRLVRAQSHPRERLIMMVFSDGYPAQPLRQYHENHCKHLYNVVQEITKAGVECIGIGIQSRAVKDYYPNHIVINSPEELIETEMGKLKEMLVANKGRARAVRL